MMLYKIVWKNLQTGGQGEGGFLFHNREHALEVARLARAENPWNHYDVIPTEEAA